MESPFIFACYPSSPFDESKQIQIREYENKSSVKDILFLFLRTYIITTQTITRTHNKNLAQSVGYKRDSTVWITPGKRGKIQHRGQQLSTWKPGLQPGLFPSRKFGQLLTASPFNEDILPSNCEIKISISEWSFCVLSAILK